MKLPAAAPIGDEPTRNLRRRQVAQLKTFIDTGPGGRQSAAAHVHARDFHIRQLLPGEVLVKRVPLLEDFADASVLPALAALLQHPDGNVRRQVAQLLARVKDPLIVIAEGGFFGKNYQYLVSYKGLAFFTKSDEALVLPPGAEIVSADRIWIPG